MPLPQQRSRRSSPAAQRTRRHQRGGRLLSSTLPPQKMSRHCSCRQHRQSSSTLPRTWLPHWPRPALAALQLRGRRRRQPLRQQRQSMQQLRQRWQLRKRLLLSRRLWKCLLRSLLWSTI